MEKTTEIDNIPPAGKSEGISAIRFIRKSDPGGEGLPLNLDPHYLKDLSRGTGGFSDRIVRNILPNFDYILDVSDSTREVPQSSGLDDMLSEGHLPGLFMRIDSRGMEMKVMDMLDETLRATEKISALIRLYPEPGESAEKTRNNLIARLASYGFRLFGIDENEYRYYPIEVSLNLERLWSANQNSSFNLLCLKDHRVVSAAFFAHDPVLSGASRSLLDLVKGLLGLGMICTVIVPAEGQLAQDMRDAGAAVLSLSSWQSKNISWLWGTTPNDDFSSAKLQFSNTIAALNDYLLPELTKLSPDFVFSQTIASPCGAICAHRLKIPHVLSIREYGKFDHQLDFFYGFEQSLKAFFDGSEKILCVTNDVKEILFGKDEESKISVIYSGIEISSKDQKPLSEKLPSQKDAAEKDVIMVGVFGSIIPGKGQEDIIRACIELLTRDFGVKCYLVGFIGNVLYYNKLKRLIDSSGFTDHFIWQTFLDNPYPLMKEMDIIVSCARMEALGRTMIEANLLKIPVIYPNSGGFKEIYKDEVHGLGYDPGDYQTLARLIRETIENKDDTRRRVAKAYELATEELSQKRYTERVTAALKDLASERSGRPGIHTLHDLLASNGLIIDQQVLFQPKLYFSSEHDTYTEQKSLRGETISFGYFSARYVLSEGYPYVRFDPLEGYAIYLEIFKMEATDAEGNKYEGPAREIFSNGVKLKEMTWKFYDLDPQVHFAFSRGIKIVSFVGEIRKIPTGELVDHLTGTIKTLASDHNRPQQENILPGGITGTVCRMIIRIGEIALKTIHSMRLQLKRGV